MCWLQRGNDSTNCDQICNLSAQLYQEMSQFGAKF